MDIERSNTFSIPQLVTAIADVDSKLNRVRNSQNCCFVPGLTGSGKSTLISTACGAALTFTQTFGMYTINHNNNAKYPEIGNTFESCTTIPSLYTSQEGLVFYDPPGFLDTKGVYQEILNSYCNAKMFRIGCKARIVMVVEISSLLSAKGGGLVEVAQRFRELFKNDFRQLVHSCLLVVSKINKTDNALEGVLRLIQRIISGNKNVLGSDGVLLL